MVSKFITIIADFCGLETVGVGRLVAPHQFHLVSLELDGCIFAELEESPDFPNQLVFEILLRLCVRSLTEVTHDLINGAGPSFAHFRAPFLAAQRIK